MFHFSFNFFFFNFMYFYIYTISFCIIRRIPIGSTIIISINFILFFIDLNGFYKRNNNRNFVWSNDPVLEGPHTEVV